MVRPPKNPVNLSAPANEPLVLFKENRLAHTAVSRLARGTAGDPVWLVFLYGPAGVGKSHLVRHFIREARRNLPRLRIQSGTASEFVARLSEAYLSDEAAEFEAQFTAIDVLVLEDLAAIEGRAAAQRMLVTILDELNRSGARVVVTCGTLPGQLKDVLPRLRNRLRGGLCIPMELLEETSRLNLAKHLAARRQIPISAQAVELLAKEGPPTPREIIAALINLEMGFRRHDRESDVALMRAQLKSSGIGEECSLPRIAKVAAKFYGIPLAELRSKRRPKRSVLPRQIAMFLSRELSGESAAAIAEFFGRKNHTTVVHACRRTRALVAGDPALAREVDRLRRLLRSS